MSSRRVSWLIPVRDGAQWIGDAVRSALADSLPDDEVVVVDDGSADAPGSVLPADPRVRLLRQPPLGIVAALEAGRAVARGELLARLDGDDMVLPGRLSAQRPLFQDPAVAAVGGQARAFSDGDVPEGMARYVAWVNSVDDPHRELLVESPMFHPATTLRASAVAAIGGYRHGPFPEDYDLFLRLASAGFRLTNVRQEVLLWRDRPGRLTRTDPRYARPAFLPLKQAWLASGPLCAPRRVILWGANRTGRPWLRWLLDAGHDVPCVVDLAPFVSRRGRPVVRPEVIVSERFDLLLVAVGSRGAREQIRAQIKRLRPDLVEGRDWFSLS
ncbi:MAG: glycosyltransferase [Myxococcales bacterium]|nr:glycosyltransferase [Myxococcales bacterium]